MTLTRRDLLALKLADSSDQLVCLFLRGAADALSLVVPYGDPDYYRLRPNLAVPAPGAGESSALKLENDPFFGLHPALAPLAPTFTAGQLAMVHACGSPSDSRSHFDAQDFMERAWLEKGGVLTGWLGRHLETAGGDDSAPFRALALGNATPVSLRGSVPATAVADIESFGVQAHAGELPALTVALQALYVGETALDGAGQQALAAEAALAAANPAQYPPENGAAYPESRFGKAMLQIAQLLKTESLGVKVACVDLGGWDTHAGQAASLPPLLTDFASGLAAFAADLGARMAGVTVVAMSEFGRRAYENASGGTDHGHGGCLWLLGGGVNGGRVYGQWPGLAANQLYGGGDLQVTTDWRTVLGELVLKRLSNPALDQVFPDYTMPGFLDVFRDR